MPLYPFETQLVVSADASHVVLTNAVVTIYDPSDTGMTTPLALTDLNGLPLANPVAVNSNGFLPAFQASVPQVMWTGGGYTGYLGSYKGILDEAIAARVSAAAAASSATGAQSAAELALAAATAAATAPTDAAIDARLAVAGAPGKWKPSTTYVTDQYVINPSGELVKAKFSHTSGASYVEANWTAGSSAAMGTLPLNVKDPRFGAKGDGTTDDTAAIQAALDAVPAGGRAVYIPAGRYKITATLKITQDGTTLCGDGAGNRVGATQDSIGTRLEAAGSITGSMLLVQRGANDRPLQGVALRDFTIDGGLVGSNVDGIIFRVNQGHIDRVHIWRCSGAGLRVTGYTSPSWDTYDTIVTSSIVGMCLGTGVVLDAKSADTHWSHCVFLNNQDNFVITGGASCQVTGCHFYTPERYDIHFNGSGSRSKFANCKIEGAKDHMVLIDTTNGGYSDIQFTGCGFSSLNQGVATNTFDYVNIQGPSGNGVSRTIFTGNTFNLKGGSTVKARYAINIASSASQNTVIVANEFGPASHWGTTALNNASNSSSLTFVKGNFGVGDIVPWNLQTTSYTAALSDLDGVVEMNSASAVTVTIPPTSSVPWIKGNVLTIQQVGAGQVTIAAGAGVTLRTPRSLTTRAQYSTIRLRMRLSNEWVLDGDMT